MIPSNANRLTESKKKKSQTDASSNSGENIKAAHDQAEQDIEKDPELSIHSPNDDLDESESARLGGDKNDLA